MGKQAQIVAAVWRVILERGIAGVSFRTVADAAGVSVGLVQHYHGSKEELIRASASAMIHGSEARYREADASQPPAEVVRHLVVHAIPTSPREIDGVVVWHAYLAACVTDDGLAALLRGAKAGQEQELARHLSGRMPASEALPVARSLIAVADGLGIRVITGELTGDEAVAAAESAIRLSLSAAARATPAMPATASGAART